MKILHVTPSYYPAFKYGGPIESVHLLNKALIKKGIQVDVLTTKAGLDGEQNIGCNDWVDVSGVRVKYFPYCLGDNYNFSLNLFLSLLKGVKNYKLIHISYVWNFPVLAGGIAASLFEVPYLISPRGTLCKEAIEIKSKQIKKLYFSLISKHYVNSANGIHFTSEDEKRNVVDYLNIKSKSYIVPNGIDLSEYENLPDKNQFKLKYPILSGKKYILFLGRINKKKGLDILVDSFKLLSKESEDYF